MLTYQLFANELRKIRNDLLMVKNNLFYPKDIDHGPTEEMITIDEITIPASSRIVKIPDTPGNSPEYDKYLSHMLKVDNFLDLYDMRVNAIIENHDGFDMLLNASLAESIVLGERILCDACKMIPNNFNRELARLYAFTSRLYQNYNVIYKVNYALSTKDITADLIENFECECTSSDSSYVSRITNASTWMRWADKIFEDGRFAVDVDEVRSCLNESVRILNYFMQILIRVNRLEEFNVYADLTSTAVSESVKTLNADYHLERSKCRFIPFDKFDTAHKLSSEEERYPYIHGDYKTEPKTEFDYNGYLGGSTISISSKIGDITELLK